MTGNDNADDHRCHNRVFLQAHSVHKTDILHQDKLIEYTTG